MFYKRDPQISFQVASRQIFVFAGVIMLCLGIVSKFGALMSSIPSPILGGQAIVGSGMLFSVSVSYLQFIDLRSPRNMVILGVSIITPLCLREFAVIHPEYLATGKNIPFEYRNLSGPDYKQARKSFGKMVPCM